MIKIGINGFGRIGRLTLKSLIQKYPEFEVVAINDLVDAKTNAFLFKYDSTYGVYPGEVKHGSDYIQIEDRKIRVFQESDPEKLPWKDLGVEFVIESTGKFTEREKAEKHLKAGAKKVIITAPAKGEDITIVLGVNEQEYDPKKHNIISNASCTTNCLAPIAKVIFKEFGIIAGHMTTIHSYTNDQRILDVAHKDLRRARAAAMNMIPTSTGAAKAVEKVIPELKGKFTGVAIRVPTPTVSLVDFVVLTEKQVTVEEVNNALKQASETYLKGILAYTEEPLVSMDFKGSTYSSIVDGLSTQVINGNMVKIFAWYDNEMGYAFRVADLLSHMVKQAIKV
ncbi:MAG: type I glyceraldehyde-3-phosphate dehydrogenase [Candidatus Calescibacterium sp.]|nr:type I glyceraldehyde-3-phosphate dehydrogenase [Candidatus Calescibacterium sp.]MCX7971826.1 type I glyceraldehyde-3-phosphate dehydrogenase [bacterium]MDW8194941.1 type I glyceraldehyde-3-phosphate dehydrogenase [Candidatus Calescibacterium sp.]